MEDNTRRNVIIVCGVLLSLLLLFFGIVTYLCWDYFAGLFVGEIYYTQEQYDQHGKEQYDEGLKNGIDEDWKQKYEEAIKKQAVTEKQLKTSQDAQKETQQQLEQVTSQLQEKESELSQKNTQISDLQGEISQNSETIMQLRGEKSQLQEQLTSVTENKENLENQIKQKEEQISQLQSDNSDKDGQISELQNEKSQLEEQLKTMTQNKQSLDVQILQKDERISQLESDNSDKDSRILQLQSEKQSLEGQVQTLTSEKQSLEETVSSQAQQITQLQSEVESYKTQVEELQSQLDAYKKYEDNTVNVAYYVENKIFDLQTVTKGETTSQSLSPDNLDRYDFKFWSSDGETAFDFEHTEINKNLRLDAVLDFKKYTVIYDINGKQTVKENVFGGSLLECPDVKYSDVIQDFQGWSLSKSNVAILDLNSYKVTSSITVYAILNYLYPTFKEYRADDLKQQYIIEDLADLKSLAKIVNAGQSFKSVQFYQADDIDFSSETEWIPIGNYEHCFSGDYNGLNYKLQNLNLTTGGVYCKLRSSTTKYDALMGVFGVFDNGLSEASTTHMCFENIIISNFNFTIVDETYKNFANHRYFGFLIADGASYSGKNIIIEGSSITGYGKDAGVVSGGFCYGGVVSAGDYSGQLYNVVSYANFSNLRRVSFPSTGHDCINYGNVDNVYNLYGLDVDGKTLYNNKNFGKFTNCDNIYGLPSYDGDLSEVVSIELFFENKKVI